MSSGAENLIATIEIVLVYIKAISVSKCDLEIKHPGIYFV